jgi:methionine-rich copper-binding protein CopC
MAVGRALLGILLAAPLALLPAPAQAHTRAVASWPAAGQVLNAPPDRVTVLYAGDPLRQVRVAVTGPDGAPLAVGDPVQDGLLVSQAVAASSAPGVYTATFTGVAVDLHTITGSFEFTLDPTATATGNPAGPPPDLAPRVEPDQRFGAQPDATDDPARAPGGSGPTLLLTGLAGVALVAALIRLAGRRRARPRP